MFKRLAIIGIVVILATAFFFRSKISLYFQSQKTSINSETQNFYIGESLDLSALAQLLQDQKLIDNIEAFVKVGEYKKLNMNNIALGKYKIEPNTNYKTLLNGFTLNSLGNGNAEVEIMVEVPGVPDIPTMIGKVAKQINIDSTEAINVIYADSTLRKYGFTKEQLPALFFANKYAMYWDTDIETFLARMAKEYKAFWTEERKAKIQKIGLKSQNEVVTLASIVYAEQSIHPEEWSIIATLYMNRIKQGMKLQSDPTFKFCWGKELVGVQRLMNLHRDVDCPYNTYHILGLPPGPISMIPAKVIDAVLNPDKNNYLYMCAKPDNSLTHNFSNSYTVHQVNAAAYHKFMDKR